MTHVELKVARIGNSRGVRLPAGTLHRYRIGDRVIMEERPDGILLRPHGAPQPKLSWDETARAMAAVSEDWSDLDATVADGLDDLPWSEGAPAWAGEAGIKRSGRRGPSKKRAARR
jgi:antitoxin component of MazEF toxin-antitoxin module